MPILDCNVFSFYNWLILFTIKALIMISNKTYFIQKCSLSPVKKKVSTLLSPTQSCSKNICTIYVCTSIILLSKYVTFHFTLNILWFQFHMYTTQINKSLPSVLQFYNFSHELWIILSENNIPFSAVKDKYYYIYWPGKPLLTWRGSLRSAHCNSIGSIGQ